MSDQQMNLELRIKTQTSDAVKSVDKLTGAVEDLQKTANKKSDGILKQLNEQAEGLLGNVTQSLGPIGGLIQKSITSPIGQATIAVGLLKQEFDFLLGQSLVGEKLNALDTQFNNLAKSAKVSGDAINQGFKNAADGLIDGSDATQIANRALVTLGEKAVQLPAILDAARKSANLFGGNVRDNFEKMVFAVESGNTRVLRSVGIFINAEKAVDTYAKKLGVAKDQLTEAGRQQAILNAILETSNTKLKEGAQSVTPLSDSLTRLGNVFNDIIEDTQKFIANNYASAFTDLFNAIANGLKKISGNFGASDRVKEITDEVDTLQTALFNAQFRIDQIGDDIAKQKEIGGIKAATSISVLNTELNKNKVIVRDNQAAIAALVAERAKLTEETEKATVKTTTSTAADVKKVEATQNLIDKNIEFVNYLKQFNGDDNLRLDARPLIDPEFFKQSTEKIKEEAVSLTEFLKSKAAEIDQSFAAGLSNAIIDFADGTENAGRAFEKFAQQFLRQIAQMILQQSILNALKAAGGFGGLFSEGGPVPEFASGGLVTGPGTGTSDSIPARLSSGEFVMRASAVRKLGVGFLSGLNNIGSNGLSTRARKANHFAEGGVVTGSGQAPQVIIQNQGTAKQTVSQETDPSTGVTTIVLDDLNRNGAISKAIATTFGTQRRSFT